MLRIKKKFRTFKQKGRKALIPYIMAGDPSLERTGEMVLLLQECGADIIELGVPFTDPLADGPVIQKAAARALEAGVRLKDIIAFVKTLRISTDIPIVLMTYYNPVFKYGEEKFVKDAVSSGVDGLIVPDLPPDEAGPLIKLSRRHGLEIIFLLAPTSTHERIRKVVKASRGFIYYVSITGITGASLQQIDRLKEPIAAVRGFTNKPVVVGFGVKTPEEASAVSEIADGVIVGSEIVRRMTERDNGSSLREFLISLRNAIG